MADYVLSPFEKDEFEGTIRVFETCSLLANEFIRTGVKGILDANSKLIIKDQTIID
ncbi:MAG: hypothetical protein IPJ75_03490 [Ignavibacteriales bacterium]|nr:hypothetical protein [Ignavibacteriales bacterium]